MSRMKRAHTDVLVELPQTKRQQTARQDCVLQRCPDPAVQYYKSQLAQQQQLTKAALAHATDLHRELKTLRDIVHTSKDELIRRCAYLEHKLHIAYARHDKHNICNYTL